MIQCVIICATDAQICIKREILQLVQPKRKCVQTYVMVMCFFSSVIVVDLWNYYPASLIQTSYVQTQQWETVDAWRTAGLFVDITEGSQPSIDTEEEVLKEESIQTVVSHKGKSKGRMNWENLHVLETVIHEPENIDLSWYRRIGEEIT